LAGREAYLRKTYGAHAQHDWWGVDEQARKNDNAPVCPPVGS
jgi:hypothetical protein